jgi:release factor glutamine methyltransferase
VIDLKTAWTQSRDRLKAAGVDSPVIDARLLLEAATGASRADIVTDPYRALTAEQQATLDGYVDRRSRREPVSKIIGRAGFWKILLRVTPDVLSPRPDTEAILDVVLPQFGEHQAFDMLDLGVGSGAILLAILAERPAARGVGTDVSFEALAVAKENAAHLGLAGRASFLRTEWGDGLAPGTFDLVVSNPPYIPTAVIPTLDPEVRDHDPVLALDGGADGLDAYRALVPQILALLKPGRPFAVEIGYDQSESVMALFVAGGATGVRTTQDLGRRDRVVSGFRPGPA